MAVDLVEHAEASLIGLLSAMVTRGLVTRHKG